jgi:raffinose/stachyose/melibiose transport system substrate-binding protein
MKFQITRRSALSGAALAVAAATLLAGCSTPSTDGGEQTLETDPAKITGDLTFATWWAYADQDLLDGFKELYPNVNVELEFTAIDTYPTKLQAQASSGDLPDVFAAQSATLSALAKADQLYDLNDAFGTAAYDSDTEWGETFNAPLLEGANSDMAQYETDGQTYGVPFNAISVASIYNQDIFTEVGITPPASFDELLDNCRALDAAGYIPMSLTGAVWGDWWTRLAWDQTLSGSAAADFTVADPNYVKGFEIVSEMAAAGCWDPSQVTTDIAAETSLFLQKKTAQFVSVPENFLASVVDGADFELGTYTLPALDGKTPNRILGGGNANVLVISKDSDNLSAAVAFAKYLTSEGVETELASSQFTIPSLDIDLSSSNPLMAAYLEAAGNGFINSAEYMPSFTPAGQTTFASEILPKLILGQFTPEQAAAATDGLFVQ